MNLGDTFFGPLDPAGTFDLIRYRRILTVEGNEERMITEKRLLKLFWWIMIFGRPQHVH